MKNSHKSISLRIFLSILIILAFVSVPATATDLSEVTPILPTPAPELRAEDIPSDSYRPGMVADVSAYVKAVNDELALNLSPEEVNQYAVTLASHYLPASEKISPTSSIRVNNYSEFQQDVVDVLDLNLIKRNNYLKLTSGSKPFCDTAEVMELTSVNSLSVRDNDYVSPASQSAPYAYGNLLYLFIFVDFDGNPSGAWTDDDIDMALREAQLGTAVMTTRAPSSANIDRMYLYYSTSVSGVDDKKSENTWGPSGWMEEAAENLGYTSSSYPRSTEHMANYLMDRYNRDSIVVIYCLHEEGRSYAINPDDGYADRCVVYFWTEQNTRYNEVNKYVYAHETLHLYGALDEYPGASYPGEASFMAVSPLNTWYTNTNHHNSSTHQHSIMCAEGLYQSNNPVISQSTKNFIGWGNYDGDGIIDVLEIRAGTA